MKNAIFKISLCFVLSIVVVAGLFAWSLQKTHEDNGFYRLLPPHPVTKSKAIDIKYNTYYFAGADQDTVYLSNYTAPLHLLKVSLLDLDTTHIQLHVEREDTIRFRRDNRIKILPPYFYYMDGIAPKIMRGKLNQWYASPFMYDSAFFNDAIPFGAKSIALKTVSSKTGERTLGMQWDIPPHIRLNPEILEKQIDGTFCTDGQLLHNQERAELVYIYYYRNQFMVMDTTMQLRYRGRTIDTISQVRIKPDSYSKGQVKKLASPSYMVNQGAYSKGAYLYVMATGMAKNDSKATFERTSTFDVYSMDNGTYVLSFQLQPYENHKISKFMVTDNYFVAIHGSHLVFYNIYQEAFLKSTNNKEYQSILSR
ncbi:hypothetical protein [Sinomicrobium sp. M5D2P9]